jgi:hypothetical protein
LDLRAVTNLSDRLSSDKESVMNKRTPILFILVLLALVGVQAAFAGPCPTGTFSCSCNGVISCQRSIQGCFDTCLVAPADKPENLVSFTGAQPTVAEMMLAQIMAPAEPASSAVFTR